MQSDDITPPPESCDVIRPLESAVVCDVTRPVESSVVCDVTRPVGSAPLQGGKTEHPEGTDGEEGLSDVTGGVLEITVRMEWKRGAG